MREWIVTALGHALDELVPSEAEAESAAMAATLLYTDFSLLPGSEEQDSARQGINSVADRGSTQGDRP